MTERATRTAVTLAAVAKRAGVATSTASLVFSGKGPVAAETAERVQRAASELGYAGPDPRAAQLRTGRTHVVGVAYDGTLADAFVDPYQVALLRGFSEVLDTAGYGLLLLPETPAREGTPPLSAHSMDAVLFAMCGEVRADIDALAARGLPLLGTGMPPDDRVVQVLINDRAGTAELVSYLRSLGHQRIGHVLMPLDRRHLPGPVTPDDVAAADFIDSRDRALGFLDAGGSADLMVAATGLTADAGYVAARTLLDAADAPTALVCQSDLLALGAMRALTERGIAVPDHMSVAGFDGIDTPGFAGTLTTVDQRPTQKGRELGEAMLALLAGESVATREFPVSLRIGTTTGGQQSAGG